MKVTSRSLLPPLLLHLLLLLLQTTRSSQGAPLAPDCDGLNQTLPAERLHTIMGDWVLVWAVTDDPASQVLMGNLLSSQVQLRLLADNHTTAYTERNLFRDKTCNRYFKNMTVTSDPADPENRTFHRVTGTLQKAGGVQQQEVSARVLYFQSCSDCLLVDYRGSVGHFLLSYRRKGHHQDLQQLQAAHSDNKKLAQCLQLPDLQPYIYDGATEFCN